MIGPVFLFGALLGIRHALDADHIAAVASLATRSRSVLQVVAVSAAWGFGHALSLLVFGSVVIALGMTISENLARMLDVAVGMTLIVLGFDVLRRLRRQRVHAHSHHHADGTVHLHVHRHGPHAEHRQHPSSTHEHEHPPLTRALAVGGVHGLAGSAALVLLSAQTTDSLAAAVAYLAAFGLGSVAGMVAFSLAISVPIRRWSAGEFQRGWSRIEAALGVATIAIGTWLTAHASGF